MELQKTTKAPKRQWDALLQVNMKAWVTWLFPPLAGALSLYSSCPYCFLFFTFGPPSSLCFSSLFSFFLHPFPFFLLLLAFLSPLSPSPLLHSFEDLVAAGSEVPGGDLIADLVDSENTKFLEKTIGKITGRKDAHIPMVGIACCVVSLSCGSLFLFFADCCVVTFLCWFSSFVVLSVFSIFVLHFLAIPNLYLSPFSFSLP